MASNPTTRNRLNKQGTGDNVDSWGNVQNTQDFDLIDEALDGITSVTVSGTVTLTSVNYAPDQARNRMLRFTGAGGTVVVPGVSKLYAIYNSCIADVTVKTAAGAGAVISAGTVTFVMCDGVTCWEATSLFPIANGSATVPSLRFTSDTNTGLYRIASDRLGITCGGIKQVDVTMANVTFTNTVFANLLRVGSGDLSSLAAGFAISYFGGTTQFGITLRPAENSTTAIAMENVAGTVVGSIVQSATTTTYNTTSDYRLKENIVDLTGSGTFIDALRPRTWSWAATGDPGAGFIAHEAQAVSPSSVMGETDAVDDQDAPIYQSMQPGSPEIIANMVAELKSLRARVAALESA